MASGGVAKTVKHISACSIAMLMLTTLPAMADKWVTREHRYAGPDGSYVYIRITCKKTSDGKPGDDARVHVTVVDPSNYFVQTDSSTTNHCPTPDDVAGRAADEFDFAYLRPAPARAATSGLVRPSPSDDRLYVANLTGPNGRSAVDVVNTKTRAIVASIDVDDRLFGGLQVAPDGRRAYALLWPRSLGSFAPAQIAFIDTATNTVVDRIDLPGLLQPQAPALSPDGRYLYFSAMTDTEAFRIRVADLQAKTVAALPAPVPTNTNLRAVSLSPDGVLLCAAGQGALTCYDTRSRTFAARVAASPPNAEMRPVFHPNGSRIYLLNRAFVNNVLAVYISVYDTATLSEVARIPIATPAANEFRDSLAVLSIDPSGLRLFLDEGFSGVLNIIEIGTNRVIKTVEGLTTGGLGGTIIAR
jgi:DNA-binding beta-propeller fold protein YncE